MRRLVCLTSIFAFAAVAFAQMPEYTVTLHEPQTDVAVVLLPVETKQRIQISYVGMMAFGLMIDQQKHLCCGAGAIRTVFKINDNLVHPNVPQNTQPLPADRTGKVPPGMQSTFSTGGIHITQRLEVIPSKPAPGAAKRQLDNCLIRYIIENRGKTPQTVGTRVRIDTMCGNNDGALFAAPTTHPGEILNGVELKGKKLPDYVQILEVPNLKNPGFHGHFTLKLPGNRITPDKFVCTAHAGGDNGWDAPVIQSNGDSDCILYWSPREVKPGEKIEMAYGYGQGIASLPESEGRVKITLGGNFEPGRLFTIQAFVEDPILGQSLTLELPEGMSLVDGSASQPAAPPTQALATSLALWRARVERPGEYSIRIRSSNGITETRKVTVAKS